MAKDSQRSAPSPRRKVSSPQQLDEMLRDPNEREVRLTKHITLLDNYPHIQALHAGRTNITDDELTDLLSHFPNLTTLNIQQSRHLTKQALLQTMSSHPNLSGLSIWGCHQIDDDGLALIGKGFKNLRVLRIDENPQFSAEAISALLGQLPLLENFSGGGLPALSGPVIDALVTHCPKMQALEFSNSNITNVDVINLTMHLPQLASLRIEFGCPNLTHQSHVLSAMIVNPKLLSALEGLREEYKRTKDPSVLQSLEHTPLSPRSPKGRPFLAEDVCLTLEARFSPRKEGPDPTCTLSARPKQAVALSPSRS